MKTISSILSVLTILLLSTVSYAQVNVGVRNGIVVSTLSTKGDLLDNSNVTLSYTAGAFMAVPVCKSFAIQPEINYVRKGRSNENAELNTTTDTDFRLDYLQVPLLLQYRDNKMIGNTGSAFYVNAGPYAAFALGSKVNPSGNIVLSESKKTDWGATIGVGFQTPAFDRSIRFDLRYDMGLSGIANQPADYRTKALSLTVGIIL
jgi:hypothetical protein